MKGKSSKSRKGRESVKTKDKQGDEEKKPKKDKKDIVEHDVSTAKGGKYHQVDKERGDTKAKSTSTEQTEQNNKKTPKNKDKEDKKKQDKGEHEKEHARQKAKHKEQQEEAEQSDNGGDVSATEEPRKDRISSKEKRRRRKVQKQSVVKVVTFQTKQGKYLSHTQYSPESDIEVDASLFVSDSIANAAWVIEKQDAHWHEVLAELYAELENIKLGDTVVSGLRSHVLKTGACLSRKDIDASYLRFVNG